MGKRNSMMRKEAMVGYLFASPWFIGLVLFTLFPIAASIRYSFMDYNILQPPVWVGLDNYKALFQDELFWISLYNTFYYVFLSVPLTMIIGLAIAMLLNADIKGIALYRTLYYMPSIVPLVAASILWAWMFDPNFGILTNIVQFFGLPAPGWLSDPAWAKNSLILMSLWGAGGGMIIYLAGLKNIPKVYYEAAEIDGAGVIHRFFKITLPLLSPTLFFQLIIGIIGSFQVFTQSFMITGGGPNDSTLFYVLYLYNNAFRFWKMGYASALAWVLFVIIMVFTWINFKLSKKWVHYDQM
ncbi:carbohydrate ABC transporter permease [Paenibacillus spongiae]|uniref:Sugar ABC transporter permease n=1 Tax=Paenibacillus spongiae TaxID=2909671 RepID=A0ABY5SFG3_9BACL|nr:sugar ABC transporter permease [Paenibacillus spongiae]UVI31245.1 sugar ABC transporter permease [Paenibacillus spongiae]